MLTNKIYAFMISDSGPGGYQIFQNIVLLMVVGDVTVTNPLLHHHTSHLLYHKMY